MVTANVGKNRAMWLMQSGHLGDMEKRNLGSPGSKDLVGEGYFKVGGTQGRRWREENLREGILLPSRRIHQ